MSGLWNLLSITREMFKRRDENALNILHTITMECLASSSVIHNILHHFFESFIILVIIYGYFPKFNVKRII